MLIDGCRDVQPDRRIQMLRWIYVHKETETERQIDELIETETNKQIDPKNWYA